MRPPGAAATRSATSRWSIRAISWIAVRAVTSDCKIGLATL